jgi:hypothetical protein
MTICVFSREELLIFSVMRNDEMPQRKMEKNREKKMIEMNCL